MKHLEAGDAEATLRHRHTTSKFTEPTKANRSIQEEPLTFFYPAGAASAWPERTRRGCRALRPS